MHLLQKIQKLNFSDNLFSLSLKAKDKAKKRRQNNGEIRRGDKFRRKPQG